MTELNSDLNQPAILSFIYKLEFTEFTLDLTHKDIMGFLAYIGSFHVITLQFSDFFEN